MLKYDRPDIKQYPDKPTAFEAKPYPYNMLADDRRFEELVYSVYRKRIEAGTLKDYDDISLMSGVRDLARDCVLYKNRKIIGVIQCKKYDQSLSKDLFGREITKFALYSILYPELIGDPHNFEYTIAVSKNLGSDCHKFIDNFSTLIQSEENLTLWITKHLKQPTLSQLTLKNSQSQVIDILKKFKIRRIQPADLDGYLTEPAVQHIVPLFFQVRTVTDNNLIEGVSRKLDKYLLNQLNAQEIQQQLQKGSSSLRNQPNQLDHVKDSHITRAETQELYDWICAPAEKNEEGKDKNICMLSGDAGAGKTVILKDLYDTLEAAGIPVLAMKADKLYPRSMPELQTSISLSLPIPEFLEQCRQQFDQTVIIIDQLDALSQSMSSDRNFLTIFRQLLDLLMHDTNFRIIISIRTFDLRYDPSFKVYQQIKTITAGELSEENVHNQLSKIGIAKSAVNTKLLKLLRTANHLNVFTTIMVGSKESELPTIYSVQELYFELWKQKVVKPTVTTVESVALKQLLYSIAQCMFDEQRIALSEHYFESNEKELAYLASERIIHREEKKLQFFHQSFYDFVFAKLFVEKKRELGEYIISQKQTLLIRSAVKMILSYLRDYSPGQYIREVETLLGDQRISFHVKHLAISLLAVIEAPSEEEELLFEQLIVPSVLYQQVFFEHVQGSGWNTVIFKSGLLDHLVKSIPADQDKHLENLRTLCAQFLRKQLAKGDNQAYDFALTIEDQETVTWLLITLDNWSSPKAFVLLEKSPQVLQEQERHFYSVLQGILEYNPIFVLEKVQGFLLTDAYYESSRRDERYRARKLAKALVQKLPEQTQPLLFNNLHTTLNNPLYLKAGINGDFKYEDFCIEKEPDSEYANGTEMLYQLLASTLRQKATTSPDEFLKIIAPLQNKTEKAYLRLLISAYKANPSFYTEQTICLLEHLIQNNLFHHGDRMSFEYRCLFEETFTFFNNLQKETAVRLIINLRVPYETFFYESEGKKRYSVSWGRTQYFTMKRLPQTYLQKNKALWNLYNVLHRKHASFEDTVRSGRIMASMVGRPLPVDAYQKMGTDNWIKSFRKYHSNETGRRSLKGGLHEHSGAFRDFAKENPEKGLRILSKIAALSDIPPNYKIWGLEGIAQSNIEAERLMPFVKLFIQDGSYQSSQYLFLPVINHLFKNDCYDDEIIDFIISESIHGEIPGHWKEERTNSDSPVDELVNMAINSPVGQAAECLAFISYPPKQQKVFDTLTHLLQLSVPPVRAVIYYRMAYLMNLDKKLTIETFLSAILVENDPQVLASSLSSLQYFVHHDFERTLPVIRKLMTIQLKGDHQKVLSNILLSCYLEDYPLSEELYKDFLRAQPEARSWSSQTVLANFYLYESSPKKCLEILCLLIESDNSDLTEEKTFSLHKLTAIKFSDIHPFLIKYMQTRHFRLSENLVEYLILSCRDRPFECIDLFNKAINKGEHEDDMLQFNDLPTQFIIAGFNALRKNDVKSDQYRQKLLGAFEKILKDHRFRNNAEKILETI